MHLILFSDVPGDSRRLNWYIQTMGEIWMKKGNTREKNQISIPWLIARENRFRCA